MNQLKIFENAEFGQMRTLQLNSETYFIGTDVARALGVSLDDIYREGIKGGD